MPTHDRYGDTIEPDPHTAAKPHDPRCRKGWLGDDLDGRPVPCLQCRPHLRATATVYDTGRTE